MKRKILAVTISVMMTILLLPNSVLAENALTHGNVEECQRNSMAVENSLVEEVVEKKDTFEIESNNITIQTPKDSKESIETEMEDGDIVGMGFPEEADVGKGKLENDGVILYEGDEDVNIYSQTEAEVIDGNEIVFNRMVLDIENVEAPHQYTFQFNMPTGYRLIRDKAYNSEQKQELLLHHDAMIEAGVSEGDFNAMIQELEISLNDIYIVDENNQVRQIIEKPWAKDANGDELNTYYRIKDNALIQTIDFDDTSKFPILADPKVGTTKSFSVKISNNAMGLPSVFGTPLTGAAKQIAQKKLKGKIATVVGTKVVPGLNYATWAATAFAAINYKSGYKGIVISGKLIYRKTSVHKGNYYVYAWGIKNIHASRY